MEWIETVIMEVDGTKFTAYDIEYSKIFLDFETLEITTTRRTTDLVKVSNIHLKSNNQFIF